MGRPMGSKNGISKKIEMICQICKKRFKIYPYRKSISKFCSKECYWKNRINKHYPKLSQAKQGSKCSEETKKRMSITRKGKRMPFGTGQKISKTKKKYFKFHPNALSGSKNPFWKGGKVKTADGYIFIYKPAHPFHNKNNYIREHRLIMEKILGRYLKRSEIVHHRNGIRNDNRPENLVLCVSNKNWHPCLCPKCGFEFLIK